MNVNLKDVTSAKIIWFVRMNLRAVTNKIYKVKVKLCCTSSNVIFLISCKLCKEQYASSAFKGHFKPRFRVHKGDVIIDKDRCDVVKHFITKCNNGSKVAKH